MCGGQGWSEGQEDRVHQPALVRMHPFPARVPSPALHHRLPPPLLPQDYSSLAPAAADAVLAFERRLEGEQRPAFEREYAAAVRDGHHARAEALLVDFTHSVVQQAAALLDGLAEQAARALGFRHVPCDKRLLSMLEEAAEAYAFEPTSDPPPSAAAEALFGTRPGGVAAQ